MLLGRFSLAVCVVIVFCRCLSVCLLVLLVGSVNGVLVLLFNGVISVC